MQENNMNYPKFKVCVRCFTFNQAKYITDALNGFTMQQTDFPFVCCIIDDASTDGEQQVIMEYVQEHFDMSDASVSYQKETDYAHITYAQHKENKNCYFAVLFLKENHYSQRKDKMPYLSEWRDNTEYEALCEGDDYWIHPKKLQMQVDFLEENPDYGLVYGKAKCLYVDVIGKARYVGSRRDGFEDMLISNGVSTPTTMYRLCLLEGYDEFVREERERQNWNMGDYPLWLFIVRRSKLYFFDKVFAVYRVLKKSASLRMSYKEASSFEESVLHIKCFFAERYGYMNLIPIIEQEFFRNMFNKAIKFSSKEDISFFFKRIKTHNIRFFVKYILCSCGIGRLLRNR